MIDGARLATDWLATGGSLLVQADYDRTLAPLVEDPAAALLPPEVRSDLRTLARSPQSRIALISRRDLADLHGRVGVGEAIYAGHHGLEIEGPDISFRHPEAEALCGVLQSLSRELTRLALSILEMRVISRRLAVSVHYGRVTPADRYRIHAALASEIRKHGGRLRLVGGIEAIEIVPWVDWNKGKCAKWIQERSWETLPPPMLTLYMGDDRDDAGDALSGPVVTIRVGGEVPAWPATHTLENTAQVRALLSALAAVVTAKSEHELDRECRASGWPSVVAGSTAEPGGAGSSARGGSE